MRDRSDFAIWLAENLGLKELASRIEMVDSYMYSLEELREKIIFLCEQEIQK